MADAEAVDIAQAIVQLSEEYDDRCEQRHAMGQEKYGAGTFLMVDTVEMALEEVIDLGNYARYTFIRLRLLQESLQQQVEVNKRVQRSGFIPTKDMLDGPS